MTDDELARHIADTAGSILLQLRDSGLFADKALGKAGDRVANAFIMEALAHHRPRLERRLHQSRSWDRRARTYSNQPIRHKA